ncbi:MAG: amidase [Dehalococcoidia bacterium]|nr:amidase [Dehalococcoidia bacterium]
MPKLYELGVAESARQIREGSITSVELAESLLERIETYDSELQAWVTVDREEVLSEARRRDEERDAGDIQGSLHGVPVGLKDIFYTEGMKTTACSPIYEDFVPGYDATCVAMLKEAGAIVLGKAVTTEFASGDPSRTCNPWNPAHTPGGSSSGSAAAVAAGMCSAALGSQTGGSTGRPAAYSGIVGLKPTYGRIGCYGVVPLSWSLDTVGILTRSVEDAAIMLQAMAGYDRNDPGSHDAPVPDYLAEMRSVDRPPRIGLIREFFYDRSSPEVREHTDAVARRLAESGAEVKEIALPDSFGSAHDCQRITSSVEAAAFHEENFMARPNDYGPRIRASIEAGMETSAVKYAQFQRLRDGFRADIADALRGVDAALMPATPEPAPRDLSTTGDPAFQSPWTLAGLPAIVIPSGLSESGLPLAVQLAGLPFQEGRMLGVARWCEDALERDLWPPAYP